MPLLHRPFFQDAFHLLNVSRVLQVAAVAARRRMFLPVAVALLPHPLASLQLDLRQGAEHVRPDWIVSKFLRHAAAGLQ